MSCVLIVEDDDDVREFMELLLSTSGYETMSAADGIDALERCGSGFRAWCGSICRCRGWTDGSFVRSNFAIHDSPRSPSSASLPSSNRTS